SYDVRIALAVFCGGQLLEGRNVPQEELLAIIQQRLRRRKDPPDGGRQRQVRLGHRQYPRRPAIVLRQYGERRIKEGQAYVAWRELHRRLPKHRVVAHGAFKIERLPGFVEFLKQQLPAQRSDSRINLFRRVGINFRDIMGLRIRVSPQPLFDHEPRTFWRNGPHGLPLGEVSSARVRLTSPQNQRQDQLPAKSPPKSPSCGLGAGHWERINGIESPA